MTSSIIESHSPQRPSDIVVEFSTTTPMEVTTSVTQSRGAQREWISLAAPARANALASAAESLVRASEELTELGIREIGKPRTEMAGEVARSVAILRYYAQQVLDPDGESYPPSDNRSLLFSLHRPHGVVGLITPWNFPLAIPMWKVAPALAFGNGVVLKPAPEAKALALRLGQLLSPCLPDGLFTVVPGDGETGRALIASTDAISFTGSLTVGKSVGSAALNARIPFQTEMGGQNASIILEDADIENAASEIAYAAMGFAGQKCTATSRVVVVGDAPAFTDALKCAIERLVIGDPSDDTTVVGPVISSAARDAVLTATSEAISAGSRLVTGGEPLDGAGWYLRPTLLDNVNPNQHIAQEEVFGPVVSVINASDIEQAISIVNGVDYGLAAALFTNDLNKALDITKQLASGLIKVNEPTTGVDYYAPFGGIKNSSYGPRERGKAARDFYTWVQTLTFSPTKT